MDEQYSFKIIQCDRRFITFCKILTLELSFSKTAMLTNLHEKGTIVNFFCRLRDMKGMSSKFIDAQGIYGCS